MEKIYYSVDYIDWEFLSKDFFEWGDALPDCGEFYKTKKDAEDSEKQTIVVIYKLNDMRYRLGEIYLNPNKKEIELYKLKFDNSEFPDNFYVTLDTLSMLYGDIDPNKIKIQEKIKTRNYFFDEESYEYEDFNDHIVKYYLT